MTERKTTDNGRFCESGGVKERIIKKYMIFGALTLAFGACGEKPTATVDLFCGGNEIKATIYSNHIDAVIDGQKVRMNRTEAASGAKYESAGLALEGAVLWNKGNDWAFTPNDPETPIFCAMKKTD